MNPIPTIQELYTTISNDLRSKLNLTDDELKTVVDAFSSVMAAQFKLAYLSLGDVQNNIFPDTADSFVNGGTLERMGRIYLNRNRNPATQGIFNVSVTGVASSVIRSGLTFKSNDDSLNPGQLYVTDVETILTGSGDVIEIRSLGGGTEFDLIVSNQLTITEPVIGVDENVTVSTVTQQPLAAETIDAYRLDILNAIQLEPQGGARTDYRLWASDAQGVRFVYPYVKDADAGTVQIYVEATKDDGSDEFGTPTQAILDAVYNPIDSSGVIEFDPDITKPLNERGRRPIQATIESLPIVTNPIDVDITGLNENTTEIQDAIFKNLNEYIRNVRPFIAGADLLRNKNDVLYDFKLSAVVTDVISSSNFFNGFIMKVNGVGQNSFLFSRENIPYLRDVNYL